MLHPRDEIAVNYMFNTNAQYRRSSSSRIRSLEENIIELQLPKNESIAKFNIKEIGVFSKWQEKLQGIVLFIG